MKNKPVVDMARELLDKLAHLEPQVAADRILEAMASIDPGMVDELVLALDNKRTVKKAA